MFVRILVKFISNLIKYYFVNMIYICQTHIKFNQMLVNVSQIDFKFNLQISGGARVAQWVRSLDLTTHTSLSPIRRGFVPGFVNYKKGCIRLTAACDKVYQLLAHGRWFPQSTPASSTTKTGGHDIAEILLKVALKHQKSNQNQINETTGNNVYYKP